MFVLLPRRMAVLCATGISLVLEGVYCEPCEVVVEGGFGEAFFGGLGSVAWVRMQRRQRRSWTGPCRRVLPDGSRRGGRRTLIRDRETDLGSPWIGAYRVSIILALTQGGFTIGHVPHSWSAVILCSGSLKVII